MPIYYTDYEVRLIIKGRLREAAQARPTNKLNTKSRFRTFWRSLFYNTHLLSDLESGEAPAQAKLAHHIKQPR